jgi:electron transfer flavoprotein beta subunit
MKAKKKPLDVLTLDTLGIATRRRVVAVHHDAPAARQKGVLVPDVATLIQELANRGLV